MKQVLKQALRRRILERLRRQPEPQRATKSRAIARRLLRLQSYRRAKAVLCYVSIRGEVDTRPLLRKIISDGKRCAVPAALRGHSRLVAAEIEDPKRDLSERNRFGVPQPRHLPRRRLRPGEIDLAVVPGVAFDRRGRRLGRGGGHFDRFLEKLPAEIPRIGLAFRFQVVEEIPWEVHDQPVNRVITD